ncbi:hypothetical protein CRX69_03705 [Pseudomonas rhizophila]|uniref:Type II toxin-antitoxin system RelE/ParE family toxin n=1 Tax=Pseudomonas rhizophila TaxID=2045200 RepID=A0ABM6UAB7_9PSED|nr:hypothetical protein CRX69_03705 [Pseudomonas rhizophila]
MHLFRCTPSMVDIAPKLDTGLWEVRIDLGDTIARVLFTVVGSDMVLLHAFIKKSQKTPTTDMATAKQRKARLLGTANEQAHRI